LIKDVRFNELPHFVSEGPTVLIGGSRFGAGRYCGALLDISSSKISYFGQEVLVPFGGFLPFRSFLNFLDIISGPDDFSSGVPVRLFGVDHSLAYVPVLCCAVLFCWGVIGRRPLPSGFFVSLAADIWFGGCLGPCHPFCFSFLRASVFNKPLLSVSNTGISAIITSAGTIISKRDFNKSRSIRLPIR
jgi:Apolipoprotein N-acyltransferase